MTADTALAELLGLLREAGHDPRQGTLRELLPVVDEWARRDIHGVDPAADEDLLLFESMLEYGQAGVKETMAPIFIVQIVRQLLFPPDDGPDRRTVSGQWRFEVTAAVEQTWPNARPRGFGGGDEF